MFFPLGTQTWGAGSTDVSRTPVRTTTGLQVQGLRHSPGCPLGEELRLPQAVSQLCASANHGCSGCVTSSLSLADSWPRRPRGLCIHITPHPLSVLIRAGSWCSFLGSLNTLSQKEGSQKGCMTRQTPSALLSALGFSFLYKKMSQGTERAGTQRRGKLQFNSQCGHLSAV